MRHPRAAAEEGSVRVGGHDVRQVKLDSLRRAMGEVPQVGYCRRAHAGA